MCSAAPAHGIEFYDETVGAGEARMGLRLRPSDPGYLAWATAIHRFYRAEEVIKAGENAFAPLLSSLLSSFNTEAGNPSQVGTRHDEGSRQPGR